MRIFDGNKIKVIRQKLGVTQKNLAMCANITREHLIEIEAGRSIPKADTLARIAEALNVEENAFFTNV